jgi:hypothetical protein
MTAKKDETEERIAREKAAKTQFAITAIDFIRPIVEERGTLLRRTVGFSHTHTIHELLNFDGFSSRVETGQTMLGGYAVKIWYHRGKQYKRGLPAVLDVWYQADIETCRLNKFDLNQQWQRALLKLIEQHGKAPVGAHRVVPVVLTKYVQEQKERNCERKEKRLYPP